MSKKFENVNQKVYARNPKRRKSSNLKRVSTSISQEGKKQLYSMKVKLGSSYAELIRKALIETYNIK